MNAFDKKDYLKMLFFYKFYDLSDVFYFILFYMDLGQLNDHRRPTTHIQSTVSFFINWSNILSCSDVTSNYLSKVDL